MEGVGCLQDDGRQQEVEEEGWRELRENLPLLLLFWLLLKMHIWTFKMIYLAIRVQVTLIFVVYDQAKGKPQKYEEAGFGNSVGY